MKIIENGMFRSTDFYNKEITPERVVGHYELELYTDGKGFSVVNGVKYPHSGCHFLFSKPGDRRFSIGIFECLYIHFESDESEVENIPCYIRKAQNDNAVNIMKSVDDFKGLKKLAEVCLLLDELSSCKEPQKYCERYIDRILMTKEYMEKNYGERITLNKLSEMVFLSKNFYRTTFERIMEISPQKYLQNIRISKALELIRQNKMQLCEIAQSCGFENQSYMNYCIKRATGKTPTEFRK